MHDQYYETNVDFETLKRELTNLTLRLQEEFEDEGMMSEEGHQMMNSAQTLLGLLASVYDI